MNNQSLQAAIAKVGGQQKLAERIGVRQSNIWHWLNRSKLGIPAEYCAAVERETGVSRHELRPDIFGPVAEAKDSKAAEVAA